MPIINANDKKKNLLAYKEKLLEEIQYYVNSIEDFRDKHKCNNYFEEPDSSDEENTFPNAVDLGPEIQQLKIEQSTLKTCLQATQELTSLTVLQSEVNILVNEPELDGERPVKEAGTWKEVTAECRIDLVPFTIAFFMHTPHRKFAPTSFRSLQVALVKKSHEVELANSVLQTIQHPSDAIEVLKSYAAAYRSRRTTLARLVNKYASSLFMEAHPEGGFILKCANLLEILWRLENKWSPVAPFHHRMKFDLEYMDESYIKIITQAHKQLLDPSLETDERTLLLSKIITTCLQARGPGDSESDLESRQTDTQADVEQKNNDDEVMAPPKSLPKKFKKNDKSKDLKENTVQKRTAEDLKEENAKRVKKNDDVIEDDVTVEKNKENVASLKVINKKDGVVIEKKTENKTGVVKKSSKNAKQIGNVNDDKEKSENVVNKQNKNKETTKITKKRKNDEIAESDVEKNNEKISEIIDAVTNKVKNANMNENIQNKNKETTKITKKLKNTHSDVEKNNENLTENIDTVVNTEKNANMNENKQNKNIETAKITKKRKNDENTQSDDAKNNEKLTENIDTLVNKEKNANANENKNKESAKIIKKRKNDENIKKDVAKTTKKIKNADKNQDTNTENSESRILKGVANVDIVKNNKQPSNNAVPKNVKTKTVEGAKKKNENENVASDGLKENNKKSKNNDNLKKIDKKSKISIANDKKFDLITKKNMGTVVNKVGNTGSKNSDDNQVKNAVTSKKVIENRVTNKTKDPIPNIENTEQKTKNIAEKKVGNNENNKKVNEASKDLQTMKKVTEKNANNIKNKDKIININKKTEKNNLIKPLQKKENKIEKNPIKFNIKSVRNITHKSPSQKNVLKIQNIGKTTKNNANILTGNTDKENGGKTKIPLKKISINSENNLKMNPLRVSPRKLSGKFKSTSQVTFKSIAKNTNIPRLMKKPVPKTSY